MGCTAVVFELLLHADVDVLLCFVRGVVFVVGGSFSSPSQHGVTLLSGYWWRITIAYVVAVSFIKIVIRLVARRVYI